MKLGYAGASHPHIPISEKAVNDPNINFGKYHGCGFVSPPLEAEGRNFQRDKKGLRSNGCVPTLLSSG